MTTFVWIRAGRFMVIKSILIQPMCCRQRRGARLESTPGAGEPATARMNVVGAKEGVSSARAGDPIHTLIPVIPLIQLACRAGSFVQWRITARSASTAPERPASSRPACRPPAPTPLGTRAAACHSYMYVHEMKGAAVHLWNIGVSLVKLLPLKPHYAQAPGKEGTEPGGAHDAADQQAHKARQLRAGLHRAGAGAERRHVHRPLQPAPHALNRLCPRLQTSRPNYKLTKESL